eukprot:3433184-Pyramimonas_sp.AAC.1
MRHAAVQVRLDVLSDGASTDEERLACALKLLRVARSLPPQACPDACPALLRHLLGKAKSALRAYPELS